MEHQHDHLFDIQIDQQTQSYLGESAKWGKFLSIVGFIMCGLLIVFALFFGSFIAEAMKNMEGGAAIGGGFLTTLYIIIAAIFFFPCYYLYNYSTKLQVALRSNDQLAFTTAFKNLKSCLKFIGIYTIVMLCFYALGLVLVFGAALVSR